MTLIAGILSRNNRPLPDSACALLRQSISRNPADEVKVFEDHRSFFAKVDVGAFGEPGFIVDQMGALSLVAGEPLLANGAAASVSNRQNDLTVIHDQCLKGNCDVLREADGTFCIVHYQPHTGALLLMADKLGIRPLYFWADDDLIVFASALRILEEFPLVPKQMDLRAVTELVGLGAPLADRTPYAGISLLRAGEIVRVTKEKISRSRYWRWDEIATSVDSEAVRLETVYDRFQTAVDRRIRNDRATTAYLSGGLDSRCVVAVLRPERARVHTFNFARPGTQDYCFGNDFAAAIGSIHESLPKEPGDSVPDYSSLMAKALKVSVSFGQSPPEHPQVVWSGEGGSVLLGMVHISKSIVELMRAGNIEGAIDEYLQREHIHVPRLLFRPQILENICQVIKRGIHEELSQLHAEDAGRNFYLFLMHNDQRRKLMNHFENIDLHRLEFQLPFFDGQFLESVIATPFDLCLRHKFYIKWLSRFIPEVTAIPWQAYPDHEPCPLATPSGLAYQWNEEYQATENGSKKRRAMRQASEMLGSVYFPNQILAKRNLGLAALIHLTGWRDYQYAIEAAQTYHIYAKKCGGEFTFSFS
jgi:asparagine synthetase B (glutamine-hydrolysing)